MRAARVERFGPPEVIRVANVARPRPCKNEVLVRIHAAGVGPWDALIRSGKSALPQPLPLTLGSDFSGVIEEVGEGVTRFRTGLSVFGATNSQFTGAQAEYAVASASMIAPKPKSWNELEAASAPIVAVTAWQMLFDYARLKAGQTALIQGAAGNVGGYVLQFAKRRGIRAIAVVKASDVGYVQSLGADHVIDYQLESFEKVSPKVDAVLDLVGGDIQERSLEVLKREGVLVSAVSPLSEQSKFRAQELGVRGLFFLVEVTTERLLRLTEMVDSEGVRAEVGEVLGLDQVRLAHEMLASPSRRKRGKIVLKIERPIS
ncbi:MAG: NADP-dependent oxidoreductase [Bdellovibrionia bacterium]